MCPIIEYYRYNKNNIIDYITIANYTVHHEIFFLIVKNLQTFCLPYVNM